MCINQARLGYSTVKQNLNILEIHYGSEGGSVQLVLYISMLIEAIFWQHASTLQIQRNENVVYHELALYISTQKWPFMTSSSISLAKACHIDVLEFNRVKMYNPVIRGKSDHQKVVYSHEIYIYIFFYF